MIGTSDFFKKIKKRLDWWFTPGSTVIVDPFDRASKDGLIPSKINYWNRRTYGRKEISSHVKGRPVKCWLWVYGAEINANEDEFYPIFYGQKVPFPKRRRNQGKTSI